MWSPRPRNVLSRIVLLLATLVVAWVSARAALPPFLEHVVGASTIEAALYRAMHVPGAAGTSTRDTLYPRPPKEAEGELTRLVSASPGDAHLLELRALTREQALDFAGAEADWKAAAERGRAGGKDAGPGEIALADFYARRLMIPEETAALTRAAALPAPPAEARTRFTGATRQRSWRLFNRLLTLLEDQSAPPATVDAAYGAWIARYPAEPAVYARYETALLDRKDYAGATALVARARGTLHDEQAFLVRAEAVVAYRRGDRDGAIAVYDRAFQPLWPASLVGPYFALLRETHSDRAMVAAARARLLAHPAGPQALDALARIFYFHQQAGDLALAERTLAGFRSARDEAIAAGKGSAWTPVELFTLAMLAESTHAYAEAARYRFALASMPGNLPAGAGGDEPAAQAGLAGLIEILLEAADQPVALGSGDLTLYREMGTLDRGPGYWNGILSLWLNGTNPAAEYDAETAKAQPYFHRAKAAELLGELDRRFPGAPERARLHREMIEALAATGESAAVLTAGREFLTAFPHAPEQVDVAGLMADSYARANDTASEFRLYDELLNELAGQTSGLPLTAAALPTSAAADLGVPSATDGEPEPAAAERPEVRRKGSEAAAAFDLVGITPSPAPLPAAVAYNRLLERYLGRLVATRQLTQALAVLRRQLDRSPDDPLLYERLATFLAANNLSAPEEEVFRLAITRFGGTGWYDKLARFYLRERRRDSFRALTREVTGIFSGTDLERFLSQNAGPERLAELSAPAPKGQSPARAPAARRARAGDAAPGPALALEINLYAAERFPHDLQFTQNLVNAYSSGPTADPRALEALLRRHWWESDDLRTEFFALLARTGRLDGELQKLKTQVAASDTAADPLAVRELAEGRVWTSNFEASAPLFSSLADLYPADADGGDRAVSLFRSLAYTDPTPASRSRAAELEARLLVAAPDSPERLTTLGDLYAEQTASGGEDLRVAAPYWRRIPALHPGLSTGYLTAATVFWDYFQFDDALGLIGDARVHLRQPALFGYEAGAIEENRGNLARAVDEYTADALAADALGYEDSAARMHLLELAVTRPAARGLVDQATARAVAASPTGIGALTLRADLLGREGRTRELAPLFDAAIGRAQAVDEAAAVGALAQSHALPAVYESALARQATLAGDPTQRIELDYRRARSLEGRGETAAASAVMDTVYRANPRLLGVVRATVDFEVRVKQPARAVSTLLEAAKVATPELKRSFTLEASARANDAGNFAQARSLAEPLLADTPYDATVLATLADSYARAGDDAGLRRFYEAQLASVRTADLSADYKREVTVTLRRGLIPALTRLKDPAGAIDQYIAILSAYPEDTATLDEATAYAVRSGRQAQLVAFLETTVKQSPRDSRFWLLLSGAQTTFGDLPAALDALSHAIEIRKDRVDLYTARVDLELRLGQTEPAAADLERLYLLTYKAPEPMVELARVRARQGRPADAVRALETAFYSGRAPTAKAAFAIAGELESWNLLAEARTFAEAGVRLSGVNLLTPPETTNFAAEGAAVYARILTRLGDPGTALRTLAAAKAAAAKSAATAPRPAALQADVSAEDAAAVAQSAAGKIRLAAQTNLAAAVRAVGTAAQTYLTPEGRLKLGATLDAMHDRRLAGSDPALALATATAAGLAEREAAWRKADLLAGAPDTEKLATFTALERSRLAFAELAATLERYAAKLPPRDRPQVREQAAAAFGDAGDAADQLRLLRPLALANDSGLRERFLDLLLRHDPAALATLAGGKDETFADAAATYALSHAPEPVALAAVRSRVRTFPPAAESALPAVTELFFTGTDTTPAVRQQTAALFTAALAPERTIGDRLGKPADPNALLTGDSFFPYASRFGLLLLAESPSRLASPEPDAAAPLIAEDLLPAELENAPSSAAGYIRLARTYAEAGDVQAAVRELNHSLELDPADYDTHDELGVLLFRERNSASRAEALAHWRTALDLLRRAENEGSARETFFVSFAQLMKHLRERGLATSLRPEIAAVLRPYLARNGNFRSNELLEAAATGTGGQQGGAAILLEVSSAASSPEIEGQILADLRSATWLSGEGKRLLLQRRLELALAQAAPAGEDSTATAPPGVVQVQTELLTSLLAEGDLPGTARLLETLPPETAAQAPFARARVIVAARTGRLAPLLKELSSKLAATPEAAGTGDDNAGTIPVIEAAADALVMPGGALPPDLAAARTLREWAFSEREAAGTLRPEDFLALAGARIAAGDLSAALPILERLSVMPAAPPAGSTGSASTLVFADSSANLDSAARLLETTHHGAAAVPFLKRLVESAPWSPAYRLRLAEAQAESPVGKSAAGSALVALAADGSAPYGTRVAAARDLARLDPAQASASLGSAELNLLAGAAVPSAPAARQPGFVAARLAVAEAPGTPAALRASLLREALAAAPGDAAAPDARLELLLAEGEAGEPEAVLTTLAVINDTPPRLFVSADQGDVSADQGDAARDDATGEEASGPDLHAAAGDDASSEVEAGTPGAATLPSSAATLDLATRLRLAETLAAAYVHAGQLPVAISYLQLAIDLKRVPGKAADAGLEARYDELNRQIGLERANRARQPAIRKDLAQPGDVRPRLTLDTLARAEAP